MSRKIKNQKGAAYKWVGKFFIFSLLIIHCTLCIDAQELRRITQDEAVELAIKNNLNLESQRIDTAQKKRKSDLFWNQFIPTVSAQAAFIGDNNKQPVTEYADISNWHFNWGVDVSLTLPVIALASGIKSLKQDYQNGVITYDKAKLQLERDIRKSYNQILLIQENYNLQQQSLDNAKAAAESARINYLNGRSPELSWLQAEVTAKNQMPAIDQTQNSLKMAKNELAMNLGLDFNELELDLEPLEEGSSFAALNTDELVKQSLERKPELLDIRAQLRTAQTQRTAQLLQIWTPAMQLKWNTSSTYTQSEIAGEKTSFTNWDDWNPKSSGGFTFALSWTPTNFLPFGANYQSIKAIDDNLSKLRIGLTQTIQATELEVYNKLFTLEQTRLSMEASEANVDLARRSYNMTRQAYGSGLQNFLQVQQSEEQLNKAQLSMHQQKFDYISNLIDLEYAIGVPFGTYSSLK
ncbi:MAG: hypothetical protein Ta2G_05180 [Termitinemataceae bacterium]|nr:MAG: hypothetical protein Ta2G_05180 [Termitinemataceae bacterium]